MDCAYTYIDIHSYFPLISPSPPYPLKDFLTYPLRLVLHVNKGPFYAILVDEVVLSQSLKFQISMLHWRFPKDPLKIKG